MGELSRELRLPARPARVDDEHACRLQGDLAAEVLLDEGERQVHARGDPGGGEHGAVADEDRLRIDVDRRVALGELGAAGPVGSDAPAVEQARLSEQERARADRRGAPGAPGDARDALEEIGIGERLADAQPAGDDQRVEFIHLAHRGIGRVGEPAGAPDVAAGAGDADELGHLAGDDARGVEDLPGAGDVERLDAAEGNDADAEGAGADHGAILQPTALSVKSYTPRFRPSSIH